MPTAAVAVPSGAFNPGLSSASGWMELNRSHPQTSPCNSRGGGRAPREPPFPFELTQELSTSVTLGTSG